MGVLDDMTKGITDRKAAAAGPKLTPVGLEASPTKPSMPKDLPGRYMAAEEVTEVAKDLRVRAQQLIEIADALDAHTGGSSARPSDPKADAIEAQKREEREADARVAAAAAAAAKPELPELPELDVVVEESGESFKERLDRLSVEAQAAVFIQADAESVRVMTQAKAGAGWQCPSHGSGSLKQLESRKGRKYMACQVAGCREFEKEHVS